MRRHPNLTRIAMLALLAGLFLACAAPSAQARSDDTRRPAAGCGLGELGSPSASARIAFTAPYVDQANWTAKVTVTVPTSWQPYADDLLMSFGSARFGRAYDCLFPRGTPLPASIALAGQHITIEIAAQGPVVSWLTPLPWPWRREPGTGGETIAASSSGSRVKFRWTAISITAQRFMLTNASPLPAAESDGTGSQLTWTDPPAGVTLPVSFTLAATADLGRELAVQSTQGLGSDIPYDVEEAVFAVMLTGLLAHRRRREPGIDNAWRATWLLCLLYAVLSSVQILADVVSQFMPSGDYPAVQAAIQVIAICVIVFRFLQLSAGNLRRAIMLTAVVLAGAGAVSYDVGLAFLHTSSDTALRALTSGACPVFLTAVLSFFYWLLPLAILVLLVRKNDEAAGPVPLPTWVLLIAAGLSALSAYSAATATAAQYALGPVGALALLTCLCIVIGVARVVAARHSGQSPAPQSEHEPDPGKPAVPMLLDRGDRWLMSVSFGFAMLISFPQTYLGVRLGMAAAISVFAAYLVLQIAAGESLVWLAREELQGVAPDQVPKLQDILFARSNRLDEVTADLKPLDGVTLANKTLQQRRGDLKAQERALRNWPALSDEDGDQQPGAPATPGAPADHDRSLPGSASPMDMVLAFGPAGDTLGNFSAAVRMICVIVPIPVCVAALHDIPSGNPVVSVLLNPTLPVLVAFSREVIFWLSPLLLLAVAWSSLAGRRGPERALQAWLCIAAPLACNVAIVLALHQAGAVSVGLRIFVLLVCLLVLGVWLDLATLRRFRRKATSLTLFHGYLRLTNSLVATLTLLIPLATAGLGIWGQIDGGALTQKPTPTQAQIGALLPTPAHSAVHARK